MHHGPGTLKKSGLSLDKKVFFGKCSLQKVYHTVYKSDVVPDCAFFIVSDREAQIGKLNNRGSIIIVRKRQKKCYFW